MTLEKLTEEIAGLYESIKSGLDRTPQGLLAELDFRCQWLARSAELEAEAQHLLDKKRGEVAEELLPRDLPAHAMRMILEEKSSLERRIYTQAERLNSTLVHQIDAIRSILSFEKESQKNNGNQMGQRR